MRQRYRDALLEYLVMSQLEDEYRGRGDLLDLRRSIGTYKLAARTRIFEELGFNESGTYA